MKYMRPSYLDISQWKILETKIIHAYNDDETPIEVINVYIGILNIYIKEGLANMQHSTCPITRWISRKEYEYLKKGEGTIIW